MNRSYTLPGRPGKQTTSCSHPKIDPIYQQTQQLRSPLDDFQCLVLGKTTQRPLPLTVRDPAADGHLSSLGPDGVTGGAEKWDFCL